MQQTRHPPCLIPALAFCHAVSRVLHGSEETEEIRVLTSRIARADIAVQFPLASC